MKNRLALWGALAVLAVGAVAIAVVAASDGDEGGEREQASAESARNEHEGDPKPLPVDPLTSLQPLLDLAAFPEYAPADDLEPMGGEAEVFRLVAAEGDPAAGVCPPDTGSQDQRCVSLGDYPLLNTGEALERLTTLHGGGAGVAPDTGAAPVEPTDPPETTQPPITAEPAPEQSPPSTACILMLPDDGEGTVCDERPDGETTPATDPPITIEPPGGPTTTAPPPQPVPTDPPITVEPPQGPPTTTAPESYKIEVTAVELIHMEISGLDDSGMFVVPIYRFTVAEGGERLVIAIADKMLTAPD